MEGGLQPARDFSPALVRGIRAPMRYKWIVADPRLLGGGLAIRGTRLSVSLILECLANGMTLADIDQSFDHAFPHAALPEVLRVASDPGRLESISHQTHSRSNHPLAVR